MIKLCSILFLLLYFLIFVDNINCTNIYVCIFKYVYNYIAGFSALKDLTPS